MLHKKLGDRFYKKKGVVESVKDKFTGMVKMIETGDKIKIDQAHLETVIPAIGKWSSVSTATPTACAHIMLEDSVVMY